MTAVAIRQATIEDAGLILQFIRELAHYEKAEDEVDATLEDIETNLFSASTTTAALICSRQDEPIGFAVYFLNFSTWLVRNGLYLEDLYVSPRHRGSGAGKSILRQLAKIAVENNCGRFEWSVLDRNEPAIKFYESIGARAQGEWIGYRLEKQALLDFASAETRAPASVAGSS